MARRGRGRRGEGGITERETKRGTLYQARWSWTEGGVRKRKAKSFTIPDEAVWWLSQSKRHGTPPEDQTAAEYLTDWLATKRDLRPSTIVQYRNHVDDHIIPLIGGHKLVALRRRHIEALVNDLLRRVSRRSPKDDPHPLSPATVGKVLVTLRMALAEAVPRQIPDNPAARVRAPLVEHDPIAAMTPADAQAIVATVKGTWLEHITRVLLGSGLRIGEAVALNQGDVHDGWVGLRRSKTTIRAVRLSADADAAIHEARRQSPRIGKAEPVFWSPRRRRGGASRDRLRGDSVTHALPKVLETAGLGHLPPHRLRHGMATLMVAAGVHMRVVAEQLGHADPALTARVYSHVSPESQVAALRVLDEAVADS